MRLPAHTGEQLRIARELDEALEGGRDMTHAMCEPFSTEELEAALHGMTAKKAAGPDGWSGALMSLPPLDFYTGLAAIWNLVLDGASIPNAS